MTASGTISIAGLGFGDPRMRTVAAQQCLDAASTIILRTAVHPGLEDLIGDPRVETCDDLYDSGANFEEVYARIADRVLDRATAGDVVLAVPGHPHFGERTVDLIREAAAKAGIAFQTVPGLSAIDAVAGALSVDPLADQVQCLDALQLDAPQADLHALSVDPYRPILVSQLYAPRVASAVKLFLMDLLPDDHLLILMRAAGVPGEERITTCKLHELDHQPVDHLTSAWVPALEPLAGIRHWATLVALVARLRAPNGCPWDRAQSHLSLRNAVLDEAYEVVDAIDAGDMANLAEELGDLLLIVAMQAQIADEENQFSVRDSLESVNSKLVRRHPHVFGELQLESADEVLQTWRGIKAAEREAKGQPAKTDDPLDRLPKSMPSLLKASKVLEKLPAAAAAGRVDAEPGEKLLAVVGEIVAAGDDPEAVLLRALKNHVANASTRSVA